jgi:hypothetical protein
MAVWELAEAAYAADDPEQSQFLAVTRLTEPTVRVVFLETHPRDSNRAQIPGIDEPMLNQCHSLTRSSTGLSLSLCYYIRPSDRRETQCCVPTHSVQKLTVSERAPPATYGCRQSRSV